MELDEVFCGLVIFLHVELLKFGFSFTFGIANSEVGFKFDEEFKV